MFVFLYHISLSHYNMIRFTEKIQRKNEKYNIEINKNVHPPPPQIPVAIKKQNNVPEIPKKQNQKSVYMSMNLSSTKYNSLPINNQYQIAPQTTFKMNIKPEEPPKIQLYPMKSSYDSVIPLNLYQTWFSKNLPPHMSEYVKELKQTNPEFQYYLFDDEDCRTFISNNFEPNVLEAFDTLIPGAYKADLWRYCVLYINGGIYLDIKYRCINGFRLIDLTEEEWFVRDTKSSESGIYNALMISKPKNPLYLKFIQKVVENVKNRYYGEHSLLPTGPLMIKKFIGSKSLVLEHFIVGDEYYIRDTNNKINIMKINEHYRLEQKNNTNNKKHYSTMWKNREIYQTPINKAPILSEITGPISLPITEPITLPISLPITEPITLPISLPITEPITLPISLPITEPITEPISLPITEPISLPITEPITLPITLPITEPITLPISLPITEPIMEPIIQLEEKESQEKTT